MTKVLANFAEICQRGEEDDGSHSACQAGPADLITLSMVTNSALLRDGLRALLGNHTRLNVVATYPGTPVAPDPGAAIYGQVVLVDSGVGQDTAVDWIRAIYGLSEPPKTIVLDLADDIERIVACIEAGASAYLLQGASADDLIRAIQDAPLERAACSPEVTARLFRRLTESRRAMAPQLANATVLTARELEVLRYIAMDWSNQRIARQLVVELSTVKHHVHNILEKLALTHRWAAVQVAREHGWLDDVRVPHVRRG